MTQQQVTNQHSTGFTLTGPNTGPGGDRATGSYSAKTFKSYSSKMYHIDSEHNQAHVTCGDCKQVFKILKTYRAKQSPPVMVGDK